MLLEDGTPHATDRPSPVAIPLTASESADVLALDEQNIYWINSSNCSTMRVRKSGGMPEIFVRGGAGGLSFDSKAIFVGVVSRESSLLHVDKVTGALGDLRDGSLPESIAVAWR